MEPVVFYSNKVKIFSVEEFFLQKACDSRDWKHKHELT